MASASRTVILALTGVFTPLLAHAQVVSREVACSRRRVIAGVTIVLSSVGYSVRSDSSGRFALNGQPGATLALFFTAPNFRRDSAVVVLPRSRALDRDFTMTSADALDPEPNLSATKLRGRVFDESGAPPSYANVQVNSGRWYLADDSGRFQLPYPGAGSSTVSVRRIGFEPAELNLATRP